MKKWTENSIEEYIQKELLDSYVYSSDVYFEMIYCDIDGDTATIGYNINTDKLYLDAPYTFKSGEVTVSLSNIDEGLNTIIVDYEEIVKKFENYDYNDYEEEDY